MKTHLLLFLFLFLNGICTAQSKIEPLDGLVKDDQKFIQGKPGKYPPLVSAYTFNQMLKKDFSMLVTGSSENSQVGKYAALSVDKNEQSFSFSPINYIINEKKTTKKFRHILAINTSGKLNNDGFFDFSDRKMLKVGGSWTCLLASTYSYSGDLPKEKRDEYAKLYELIKKDLLKKKNTTDSLEKIKYEKVDFEELYHEEVEKHENMLYKDLWTKKLIAWFKLDVGYAEDKLRIIDSINVRNSVVEPIKKNINGGYGSLSGNIFYGFKGGYNIYFSAQISYSKKTSLSEIFSTVEWNRIQYGENTNNTVYYDMGQDNVFITNINSLEKRYKRDIFVQLLGFIPLGQRNLIGLDFSYQNKEFITPGSKTFTSNKNIYSVGIMFPLKDKDGKITINVEPFWRSTSFSNYDTGKEESFWGVKFGVPLNQLF